MKKKGTKSNGFVIYVKNQIKNAEKGKKWQVCHDLIFKFKDWGFNGFEVVYDAIKTTSKKLTKKDFIGKIFNSLGESGYDVQMNFCYKLVKKFKICTEQIYKAVKKYLPKKTPYKAFNAKINLIDFLIKFDLKWSQ